MRRWEGKTVVCIGSGPSLTPEDCDYIRRSGAPCIALNSSWKVARFAEILFAGDFAWWKANIDSIDIDIEKWTCSRTARDRYGINISPHTGVDWHSGLRAVQLAEWFGASKILLVGYDCSVDQGTHHHGHHVATTNPTASVCKGWRRQFAYLASVTKAEIINCSRRTALQAFPCRNLEEVLYAGQY